MSEKIDTYCLSFNKRICPRDCIYFNRDGFWLEDVDYWERCKIKYETNVRETVKEWCIGDRYAIITSLSRLEYEMLVILTKEGKVIKITGEEE